MGQREKWWDKSEARKMGREKWGVKSKARKVGHKVESEKWGEKSGGKRKVGRDKSEVPEKWDEKSWA